MTETETATARVFFASGIARLSLDGRVDVSPASMLTVAHVVARAAGLRAQPDVRELAGSRTALKWRAIHALLLAGRRVLALDPNVALLSDPSPHFSRDVDVEAASDGWDDVPLRVPSHVVDDPAMGWSRFCHARAGVDARSGVRRDGAHARSGEARRDGRRQSRREGPRRARAEKDRPSSTPADVHARGLRTLGVQRGASSSVARVVRLPGATRRALNYLCFANTKALFRFVRKDARWREPAEHVPVAVRVEATRTNPSSRLEE